jgi:phytoene dehydrogenase-like protein
MKKDFANQIIDALDEKLGDIKQHIEETDITTPATYHRYTGNFQGSVQGWLPPKNLKAGTPIKTGLPGLKNFYFTGHWSHLGGGLPIAIKSGRDIAKIICQKYNVPFKLTPIK